MKEQGIQNIIRMAMSAAGVTNWRNNTGTGWVGKVTKIQHKVSVLLEPGDVVIRQARPLRAGLCVGSADVIGITPVRVTEDHLGQSLGVFTAIEVKNKNGKPTKEQLNFLQAVEMSGGFAGIAKSVDDLDVIINRD